MVVFSFRSKAPSSPLWRTRIVPIVVPVFAHPLPSRPKRCPICNHARVAPRCRHSVSCAADIIARPDVKRGEEGGGDPLAGVKWYFLDNSSRKKERRKKERKRLGSVEEEIFRKREMSLLARFLSACAERLTFSLSLSFSFFPRRGDTLLVLDLENLRSGLLFG